MWLGFGLLAIASAGLQRILDRNRLRSLGCASGSLGAGIRQQRFLDVPDNAFEGGTVKRSFKVTVPNNPSGAPMPVLFNYHGWGDTNEDIAKAHTFDELAEQHKFVVVYPQGMDDYEVEEGKDEKWGSWNLGRLTEDACAVEKAYVSTEKAYCYKSCSECNACSWTTCADDVAFTDAMVSSLTESACVDPSRYYAYGESNGAMFIYKLLQDRPGLFAAAVIEQGLPMKGYQGKAVEASILHLHDRGDTTCPLNGEQSWDGYKYLSLEATLTSVCGTNAAETPFDTVISGGPRNTECVQRTGCAANQVVACLYDGKHGDLPAVVDGKNDHGDSFIWSFLKQHSRAEPSASSLQADVTVTVNVSVSQLELGSSFTARDVSQPELGSSLATKDDVPILLRSHARDMRQQPL